MNIKSENGCVIKASLIYSNCFLENKILKKVKSQQIYVSSLVIFLAPPPPPPSMNRSCLNTCIQTQQLVAAAIARPAWHSIAFGYTHAIYTHRLRKEDTRKASGPDFLNHE